MEDKNVLPEAWALASFKPDAPWYMLIFHSVLGNHARGWNDPPQFKYDAQGVKVTASNPLATNKRIGHDLLNLHQKQAGVSPQCIDAESPPFAQTGLPVPALKPVPILNMPDKPTAAEASEHTLQLVLPDMADDTEFCMYCSRCFQECTETLLAEQLLQARLAADVNKRIGIFEKSWNSGKLSPNAKPTVGHLARALELKEYKLADKIHMKLVTDHISEVSQWIVGIKKLIQAGCSPS